MKEFHRYLKIEDVPLKPIEEDHQLSVAMTALKYVGRLNANPPQSVQIPLSDFIKSESPVTGKVHVAADDYIRVAISHPCVGEMSEVFGEDAFTTVTKMVLDSIDPTTGVYANIDDKYRINVAPSGYKDILRVLVSRNEVTDDLLFLIRSALNVMLLHIRVIFQCLEYAKSINQVKED